MPKATSILNWTGHSPPDLVMKMNKVYLCVRARLPKSTDLPKFRLDRVPTLVFPCI